MTAFPCYAALWLTIGLSHLSEADDQPVNTGAVNLVRDVPGATARVSVDSTFPGYGSDVLTDGRWIAEGQESATAWGDPDRLGNGGNTWVSAEAADEHWMQLDWPHPVRLNVVEIVWSLGHWHPRAVRIQRLSGDQWVDVDPTVAAWEPIARHGVIVTPTLDVTSLRILQPAGCSGVRELLAAQEIAVYFRSGGGASRGQGVQALNAQQMSRLIPKAPRKNIALLHQDFPGAADAVRYTRDETRAPVPALADGDRLAAATLPADTIAVGVEWPIRHVVDHVSLICADGATGADSLALELFDEQAWTPVHSGLTVTSTPSANQVDWSFAPVATRGLRVRSSQVAAWRPAELEVQRYWPADKATWPDRLVQRGTLEGELLAGDADPSFEKVAAAALSMTPARAFVGTRDGTHEVGVAWDGTILGRETLSFVIGPSRYRLAESRETVARGLLDGWRPAVVTTARLGESLQVCQTVFSMALGTDPDRAVTFIRLRLKNLTDQPLECPVQVDVRGDRPGSVTRVDDTLRRGDDVVLVCRLPTDAAFADDPPTMQIATTIPSQGEVTVDFVHPHPERLTPDELVACRATTYEQALAQFRDRWDELLQGAVQVELPEPRIQRMYRAVLAQLLVNADGDLMPYGAAPSVYEGALFGIEESYAMLALADWGLAADAQRYLDATYLTPEFLRKVEAYRDYPDRHQQYRNGLEPHYAVAAYRLSRDRAWIGRHVPLLRTCAEWTIAQRRKTMELQDGQRPMHWGLLPKWSYGGDIAEVECYALFANFCCWRGLVDTAWLLEELGDESTAQQYADEAAAYRRDIERAMAGTYQAAAEPPFMPLRLYASKPDEQMDYYQLFAGCMLDVDFLGPEDDPYRWIMDFMAADNRVFCGLPRFRRDAGAGGLDALYGKGYLLSKLRAHDVREFLLGFYAFLAFNLDHDTFTSRETNVLYASDLHVRSAYPVPDVSDPVPCSSAVALHFLRHMLATEVSSAGDPPDTLLLMAGVPRHWLADGNAIRFDQLPTAFGPTSVNVRSAVHDGRIVVDVQPPVRQPPRTIRLRLRHPQGRPIRSVQINGQAWTRLAPGDETIELPVSNDAQQVVVAF